MFRILNDVTNLQLVFANYSAAEALKVQHNIRAVTATLRIPGAELLRQMRAEGLDITEFDTVPATIGSAPLDCSETVLRSHLRTLFLSQQKLETALQGLSLTQRVTVRDQLEFASSSLRLPSEQLLQRMAEQGLTLDKLGLGQSAGQDKISAIRQRLAGALAPAAEADKVAQVKQRLTALNGAIDLAEEDVNTATRSFNVVNLEQAQARVANSRR